MTNVLLLRNRSEDGPDKYEDAFKAQGYNPICVPVLETGFVNIEDLEIIVKKGNATEPYAGVIITSARACEAWRTAVEQLHSKSDVQHPAGEPADWSAVPFYVVGEATATALRDIHQAFPGSPYVPTNLRGAAETGTSERLANFILDDLASTTGSRTLFYLTGDKNRETLPKILQQGGFQLSSLQVYETHGSSAFPADLEEAIDSHPSDKPWWIVFFAPSAADFVTPFLREHFHLRSTTNASVANGSSKLHAKVAAIGPTTSTFLTESLKLGVDVVSSQPKPESLVAAIEDAHGRMK